MEPRAEDHLLLGVHRQEAEELSSHLGVLLEEAGKEVLNPVIKINR